jgi:enoyl-CoA hydratase
MEYKTIIYEKRNGIGTVTLNRPEVLNSINRLLAKELFEVFDEIADNDEVKVVILTGSGRAFCVGADIKELASSGASPVPLSKTYPNAKKIESLDKPVVVAINGYAIGGGLELAMACDLRIASDISAFGLGEIKLGLLPGAGGTVRLPRLVGITKAKEMLFLGDLINAEEAYRIGLVNKIVPLKSLPSATENVARELAKRPSLALKMAKSCINQGMQMTLDAALEYEDKALTLLLNSKDYIEGLRAFMEKRSPDFRGR